jgi:hypothetical protein
MQLELYDSATEFDLELEALRAEARRRAALCADELGTPDPEWLQFLKEWLFGCGAAVMAGLGGAITYALVSELDSELAILAAVAAAGLLVAMADYHP